MPQGSSAPEQRDRNLPLIGAISMWVEFIFHSLFFLLINGDVWAFPPHTPVCPAGYPTPACLPPFVLLVDELPQVLTPSPYVFQVNGFRCEHHVLTVAL